MTALFLIKVFPDKLLDVPLHAAFTIQPFNDIRIFRLVELYRDPLDVFVLPSLDRFTFFIQSHHLPFYILYDRFTIYRVRKQVEKYF